MELATIKDVSFAYDGKVAIEKLNFHILENDYLAIIGENGAGKSTLIKGMLGLLQPSNGNISFSSKITPKEIGYLPQQTMAQKDFPASVYEVVISGRLGGKGIISFYSKEDKEIAIENMKRLGIENLANKCYRELSGGQQQRVLLARALCSTDKLLVLDEPASGLDPLATNEMYQFIKTLNESGVAIVMVTHDILALNHAKNVLHLANKQVFWGNVKEYKKTKIGKQFVGGAK